jgi:hypothetical protein
MQLKTGYRAPFSRLKGTEFSTDLLEIQIFFANPVAIANLHGLRGLQPARFHALKAFHSSRHFSTGRFPASFRPVL